MLKIDKLTYRHKEMDEYRYALEVSRGEIVAILGESGSGKSTLLDLIAGFLEHSSGSIAFEKKQLGRIPVEQRPVSILFQNHNLFEHLTVEKNILLGIPKNRNIQIEEILEKVGLEGMAFKKVTELSGGQQQRVALARVLLRDKPILLLDEPFSSLDHKTREQMLLLVQSITQEKKLCTIMITHDIEDSHKIADSSYSMLNHELVKTK